MKILLAYEWCLIGGVEAFMVSLADELKRRGHECELFFFTRGPMEEQLPAGLAAHFGDLGDCMKLVRSGRFDLVHANSSDWRVGITAVRSVGARLVITAHGMVVKGWNSTNCDGFACCSGWQAAEQRAFTDLPIHTIYNGIDTDAFAPAPDAAPDPPPVVAWVGRGTDMVHKRIDKLAEVAPLLRAAGVRLWIADPFGPDEVEKVVPEAARVLRDAAEFWGGVPRDELPQFFRRVAASGGCVLSTSIREGLSMALIEAQASGCPAVGPDVRGVNEVIAPEHGGLLYPFGAPPEELARLILGLVADPETSRRRGARSAAHAREQFALGRMTDEYVRLYESVLGAPRRRLAAKRARLWLAPLLNWGEYVERRWTAGERLHEASVSLAERGEWELAGRAARLSVETCPSLYTRPERLARLLKILLRPNSSANGRRAMK